MMIRQVAFAGALLIAPMESTWAARTVTLLCPGTFHAVAFHGPVIPTSETLQIDYDAQTVSGGTTGSPYPFVSQSQTLIEFSKAYLTKGDIPVIAKGKIDRVSGETTIMISRQDRSQEIMIFYALKCQPARPAF